MNQIIPSSDMVTPSLGEPAPATGNPNPYFLDMDRLLAHIENATSYYQILNVGRDAARDQIHSAFRETLSMLYPPYQVGATLPAELLVRIDRAFNKLTQAFAVLASFARRREYDSALSPTAVSVPDAAPGKQAQPQAVSIRSQLTPRHAYVESARVASNNNRNRRRTDRLKFSIPARVVGVDRQAEGKWSEMAETLDVSRTGVRLRLKRPVRYGMVLYLSLPLPPKLRSHGFTDPTYNVYALVRRSEPPKKGERIIGLEFIGEHPPPGYLDKPWATFRTTRWAGNERRRSPRFERAEPVRLEYISADKPSTFREEAKVENVSRTGLRVIVRSAPPEFDLIRLTNAARQFEALAILRNRFQGKDGLERLCLQLLDKTWPV
ncbi:MAG: PilZ domain-containing protein [Blastocatellia bacterium]